MRKSVKIFLIVFVVVLITVGLGIVIKFNSVKDLICFIEYPGTENKDEFIFKFNNKGIIKKYVKKQINTYSTEEEAEQQYKAHIDSLKKVDKNITIEYDDIKVEKNDKSVIVYFYYNNLENDVKYNKNREELKKIYIEGYGYSCGE